MICQMYGNISVLVLKPYVLKQVAIKYNKSNNQNTSLYMREAVSKCEKIRKYAHR